MTDDHLVDELRSLGRTLTTTAPEPGLEDAVLARITAPTWRERLRRKWRALVAGLLVLLGGLALVPPVRATVAEWFGIGGIVVRPDSTPGPSTAPPPPSARSGLSLDEAARLVGFTPVVPTTLGAPDGVEVSDRVLSMSWRTTSGTIRLDQFDGTISPVFTKQVHDRYRMIEVDGVAMLWFPNPHYLVLWDAQQVERTTEARTAGPTLAWEHDGLTFRLEGVRDESRAIEIARSAVRR